MYRTRSYNHYNEVSFDDVVLSSKLNEVRRCASAVCYNSNLSLYLKSFCHSNRARLYQLCCRRGQNVVNIEKH